MTGYVCAEYTQIATHKLLMLLPTTKSCAGNLLSHPKPMIMSFHLRVPTSGDVSYVEERAFTISNLNFIKNKG